VLAESTCSTGELLELRDADGGDLDSVELFERRKDDAFDLAREKKASESLESISKVNSSTTENDGSKTSLQVQSHPDSIRSDDDIISALRVVEELGLIRSSLGRKRSVRNGASQPGGLFDLGLEREDLLPRPCNDAVPLLDSFPVSLQTLLGDFETRQTLVVVDNDLVSKLLHHSSDETDDGRFSAEVDVPSPRAEESVRPTPSSVPVGDHLDLVKDGDLELRTRSTDHLDGRTGERRVLANDTDLLSG
jgi:hypothetical protein